MTSPEKSAPDRQLVRICKSLSSQEANNFSLVLSSLNLFHQMERTSQGWELWVPATVELEATAAIEAYMAENQTEDETTTVSTWPLNRTFAGVYVAIFLLAVYLIFRNDADPAALKRYYGASAEAILAGQWYRLATALLLHADAVHLIANIIGMALFATAVCATAGFGAGVLMILASGMMGNLANAYLFQSGHLSIGASTAVFGAVGIAAAHQFVINWRRKGRRAKAWVPLGGGLALLGMMGSSVNTDLTAHFFGFVCGAAIGIAFSVTRQAPPPKHLQYGCLLIAILIAITSFTTG